MTVDLRLGVIGLSLGNGHPYSWSAIFNGYEPEAMERCGFPVIPRYLEKQNFPECSIKGARVTHVWTQDAALSSRVARAARISYVVDDFRDMVGKVDGVLLARDDADTHLYFARPFLEAGLPIYIDKPLALSRIDAEKILELQRFPGQIFSCSALRYAADMMLSEVARAEVGEIRHVIAASPKDWQKYSMHIIDPMLNLLGYESPEVFQTHSSGDTTMLTALHPSGVVVNLSTLGDAASPIHMMVVGSQGTCNLQFANTFAAFRAALQEFVRGIKVRDVRTTSKELLSAVSWLEAGLRR